MLTADALATAVTVRHGFFTREGGVSEGAYASLNCGLGSADAPERVRENRSRAMQRLGLPASALATAYQVHSARVAVIDAPWPDAARPQLDAMVTRTPGVALGILTADCAPVLLADPEAGVIGAAHAGWRGAKSGILEATVAAMVESRGAAGSDRRRGRALHPPGLLRGRPGVPRRLRRRRARRHRALPAAAIATATTASISPATSSAAWSAPGSCSRQCFPMTPLPGPTVSSATAG